MKPKYARYSREENQRLRVIRTKRKYGKDIFSVWAKLGGGNPVLKAQAEGRVTIHAKKRIAKRRII